MGLLSIAKVSGTAVVTIDNPPVNALSHAVRLALRDALEKTEADDGVTAVVLACAGRTFIAGADMREFGQRAKAPQLPDLIRQLENASKPWVAAIHGTALGGGLELALGCRYRIAHTEARLGLPEVHLGLIPGAGGTVRLPRLVAAETALDMICGGKPVTAGFALAAGLIDRIADTDLRADAVKLAAEIRGGPLRAPVIALPVSQPADMDGWRVQKAAIAKKARGQISPVSAIEALESALSLPAEDALRKERELFTVLKGSPQSAALRYVFFAERSVAKTPALKDISPGNIDRIGVVGGGTMGAGIAAACLLAGLQVTMIERSDDSLSAGRDRVMAILRDSQARGLITAEKLARYADTMSGALAYDALSDADLVIEAVFEDMSAKKQVFAELDRVTRRDAVLATNTSYLDVGDIASVVSDPTRVLGLHFFAPAHIMKLLEIISPAHVAPNVLATGFALAKRLGKIAVPSGVCDGFIANRMMSAYRREAEYMIEDGALPHQVDQAMVQFGFAMGIFAMQDLAGLDIGWATRKRRAATRPTHERYVAIADRLCELGRFGRKTGRGWYEYAGGPAGRPDPDVEQIILSESARNGIRRQNIPADRIMRRILSAMQSEGRAIVHENIADSARAIDVVMVHGFGFPRWRGGPMYMSDSL